MNKIASLKRLSDPKKNAVIGASKSNVSKLAHGPGNRLSRLGINPIVFSRGEWIALDVKVVLEPKYQPNKILDKSDLME
jgi:hypothetical protein